MYNIWKNLCPELAPEYMVGSTQSCTSCLTNNKQLIILAFRLGLNIGEIPKSSTR
jgi:hypothetical protein